MGWGGTPGWHHKAWVPVPDPYLLPDVFEFVARSGGACFLFCRLGLILFVLSTSGSCSESANQLMTTQVLPLRASEIEGAFITLG